ncbi:hypothetical protein N9W79_01120 [bacterium]|nr:hypothetical protein [bacterium]
MARTIFAKSTNVERLARTPFSDGAWARGQYGATISAGISAINLEKLDQTQSNENRLLETTEGFVWQKFELAKGIIWPVDMNVSFSYNDENKMLKWNGMLQHSFFQRPLLPSIAVRADYSKLYNNQDLNSSNYSLALASSWGYRFVHLFASRNENLNSQESAKYNLDLISHSSTDQLGLQINMNPLSKVSFSKTWENGQTISNEIKVSVGL